MMTYIRDWNALLVIRAEWRRLINGGVGQQDGCRLSSVRSREVKIRPGTIQERYLYLGAARLKGCGYFPWEEECLCIPTEFLPGNRLFLYGVYLSGYSSFDIPTAIRKLRQQGIDSVSVTVGWQDS